MSKDIKKEREFTVEIERAFREMEKWSKDREPADRDLKKVNEQEHCSFYMTSAVYCPKIKQFLKCVGMCTRCARMTGWNKTTGAPVCELENTVKFFKDSE